MVISHWTKRKICSNIPQGAPTSGDRVAIRRVRITPGEKQASYTHRFVESVWQLLETLLLACLRVEIL
ncbi:hypothetical protein [Nostoc sp. KVJ20]|uniref:hypothetical protein n=1 Tax=Nostoc sp. KVJ20 TaxID=457944 RepID=UPI00114CCEB6|nr:hypothetical protein [Nostoc sp. KVJ20]